MPPKKTLPLGAVESNDHASDMSAKVGVEPHGVSHIQQVAKVKEVCSEHSKDTIQKLLVSLNGDVQATINALQEGMAILVDVLMLNM